VRAPPARGLPGHGDMPSAAQGSPTTPAGTIAGGLDRAWRLIGTGIAFAVFFWGGGLLAVLVLPLLAFGARQPADRVQRFLRQLFIFYLWLFQALGVLRLKVVGGERLSQCRGRLIVANHPSLLDVVFLMALVPRASCIVKSELWENFFLGRVVRAAGYIRNDLPADELVAACRDSLAQGGNLIVFPEGTRSKPGEPPRFHRGFANIALLAGVDIQLVVITCDPMTLTKDEPWYRIPPRRPLFCVEIAHEIGVGEFRDRPHRGIGSRELTRQLEHFYTMRLGHG
jgi:1-acyl-sn-glycerol-3-phosphate acyltransferase